MKIILVRSRHGNTRSISLNRWVFAALVSFVLVAPIVCVWVSVSLYNQKVLTEQTTLAWQQVLQQQEDSLRDIEASSDRHIAALTTRASELQARLVRLDALGERLTSLAKLDRGEFNFNEVPALGGPEMPVSGEAVTYSELTQNLAALGDQIENRQDQLDTLETLLANRKLLKEVFVAGRPIKKGWMSSRFGKRNDPFTGRVAWHQGVDFAGKMGADVIAVASGVVTWSGDRYGYGKMVEVNHGNGFVTRYAHAQENLVSVGDVVKKGQVVALMGSSGRSTGPHVHFEVYKNGRAVDPARYIHRASR